MDDEDTAENKAEFKYLCYVPDGRWKFHKKDDVEIVDPKFVFYGQCKLHLSLKLGIILEMMIFRLQMCTGILKQLTDLIFIHIYFIKTSTYYFP